MWTIIAFRVIIDSFAKRSPEFMIYFYWLIIFCVSHLINFRQAHITWALQPIYDVVFFFFLVFLLTHFKAKIWSILAFSTSLYWLSLIWKGRFTSRLLIEIHLQHDSFLWINMRKVFQNKIFRVIMYYTLFILFTLLYYDKFKNQRYITMWNFTPLVIWLLIVRIKNFWIFDST